MFSRLTLAAGAVLGASAAAATFTVLNVLLWLPTARDEGRDLERADALKRSIEIIQQRSRTNAEVNALDARGICIDLGGEWVQDHCE
ncbi:hypothetical protein IB238_09055 [Rhizobium sp. ARZ01]|uniref:hypothetical protein n=1 Tax=Rhizobium sp. ARZ01 TaxID=2769313 RepID=UPI00177EAAFE|nr:hypothetical protein [Rhizobium sp. ARZ01]MBD9372768.1 hypothetical protein [Rhizobium sp. ARZ01]